MKKQHRTIVVMLVAVATAGLASFGMYRVVQRMPARQVEVDNLQVVVAAQSLPMGTRLHPNQLRTVAWPKSNPVPGSFADPKALIDRGVIVTIGENEPITESKIASLEAGVRACRQSSPRACAPSRSRSTKWSASPASCSPARELTCWSPCKSSNNTANDEPMTRTVVSKVEVLTAGTKFDQEKSKDGKPIATSVVTLAVLPEDAERIALASNEGKITLALRNPLDVDATDTRGIRLAALMRGTGPEPVVDPVRNRVVARKAAPHPAALPLFTPLKPFAPQSGARRW